MDLLLHLELLLRGREVAQAHAVRQVGELLDDLGGPPKLVLPAPGDSDLEQLLLEGDQLVLEVQGASSDRLAAVVVGQVREEARGLRPDLLDVVDGRGRRVQILADGQAQLALRQHVGLAARGVRILAHLDLLGLLLASGHKRDGVGSRRHEHGQAAAAGEGTEALGPGLQV